MSRSLAITSMMAMAGLSCALEAPSVAGLDAGLSSSGSGGNDTRDRFGRIVVWGNRRRQHGIGGSPAIRRGRRERRSGAAERAVSAGGRWAWAESQGGSGGAPPMSRRG